MLATTATADSRRGIVDFERLENKINEIRDEKRYYKYARSEVECKPKCRSKKDKCEVRQDANWHIWFKRWHNFVKVLNAIR